MAAASWAAPPPPKKAQSTRFRPSRRLSGLGCIWDAKQGCEAKVLARDGIACCVVLRNDSSKCIWAGTGSVCQVWRRAWCALPSITGGSNSERGRAVPRTNDEHYYTRPQIAFRSLLYLAPTADASTRSCKRKQGGGCSRSRATQGQELQPGAMGGCWSGMRGNHCETKCLSHLCCNVDATRP